MFEFSLGTSEGTLRLHLTRDISMYIPQKEKNPVISPIESITGFIGCKEQCVKIITTGRAGGMHRPP